MSPPHHRHAALHLVAWDAAVPRVLQVRHVPPAPPCRAAQLRVSGSGFSFIPAVMGGTGSVTLRNAGPRACALTGRPRVRAIGAPKAPPQHQTDLPAGTPSFPAVVPPPATLLALAAGASATLTVDWRNWCVPGARSAGRTKRLVPPSALQVTLPGGGSLRTGYNAVPGCDSPGRGDLPVLSSRMIFIEGHPIVSPRGRLSTAPAATAINKRCITAGAA
jgi:hypothetical protein